MSNNFSAYLFKVKPISDLSILQDFEEEDFYYSYFQINQNYYLFAFGRNEARDETEKSLFQKIGVIQVLDKKKRKIRSLRGYFLYVLEIMKKSDRMTELSSNLRPMFWYRVEDIIRQNKKNGLYEFVFGPELLWNENQNLSFLDVTSKLENEIKWIKRKLNELETSKKDETLHGTN